MKIGRHKYPQNTWANEILKIFNAYPFLKEQTIVDAPCGNGIIANLVHNELVNSKFILVDNDPKLLCSPYAVSSPNFQVKVEDIFKFKLEETNNTWLLINSLYCLPNSDKLIADKRGQFKNIIAIFPNIHASNFKYFSKKNPNFSNESALDLESTVKLFGIHGYKMIHQKSITNIAFHKWNAIFSFLKFPIFMKNFILNLFDKILFFFPGQYTIIVFERNE